jgi:uncharacterized membrane protein required for colicin V production
MDSQRILDLKILWIVLAFILGAFLGHHFNMAFVQYLHQNYDFNENINSIIGLLVNIGIIVLSVYLVLKFLIIPAKRKLENVNSDKDEK